MATVDRSDSGARTIPGDVWWEQRGVMRALAILSVLLVLGVPLAQSLWAQDEDWYSVVAPGFVLLALAFAYRRFLRPLVRYLLGHLGQAVVLVLLLLLVWGQVGVGLGIPNLIWDEDPFVRSASALGATLLLALLGINTYYLGIMPARAVSNNCMDNIKDYLDRYSIHIPFGSWLEPDPRSQRPDEVNRRNLSLFLRLSRLPFLILISLPALFPRVFYYVPWDAPGILGWPEQWIIIRGDIRSDPGVYFLGLAVWATGLLAGVFLIKLLLRVSSVLSGGWRSDLADLADAPGGRGRVGRGLRSAALWVGTRPLGGFEQYLTWSLVVYVFLALAASESPAANRLAYCLLLAVVVSQLIVLLILFLKRGPGTVEARIILGLCLLTGGCGYLAIWALRVPSSFAIFALLGLVAMVNAIYERRDARPIYVLFGLLLLALIAIINIRSQEGGGEPVSAQEKLAPAALVAVFGFGLAQRYLRRADEASEGRSFLALLAALALFGIALLPIFLVEPPEFPAVCLAAIFFLLGCCTLWSGHGRGPADDRDGREKRRWALLSTAMVFWLLLVNYDPFKDRFDNLSYGYVFQDPLKPNSVSRIINTHYPYEIEETLTARDGELLENRAVLDAWLKTVGDSRLRGYDVRLVPWGDGSKVSPWDHSLVIAGIDDDDLLHIRTFDTDGVRKDTYEKKIEGGAHLLASADASCDVLEGGAHHLVSADASGNVLSEAPKSEAQAEAIKALKRRLTGLSRTKVLGDSEKAEVLGEVRSITGQALPKLVIVCVSGGAIRSAYWAVTVLDRLGRHQGLEDFHKHVRLITGASGGMVGMSYYVRSRWLQQEPDQGFRASDCRIPRKSLNPVSCFIALQAPWRMLLPRLPVAAASDRGQVLERDWTDIRRVTFRDLYEAEGKGRVPSLIFSPMIVDDGRRLLISNLDLMTHRRSCAKPGKDCKHEHSTDEADRYSEWAIPVNRHNDLDNDNDGKGRNAISISALELFKLIGSDDAKRMSLATAARMSATFPFVSPAVNLPTDPPLRVVDAGYYDNYGVHLANAWILQNRHWLKQHTSGVLVVQIRDSVSKLDRLGVPSESRGFLDRALQGAQLISSVGGALVRAHYSTNTFRNDQEFVAVNEVFRNMGTGNGFVATVVFENTAFVSANTAGTSPTEAARRWPGLDEDGIRVHGSDVPMSWYLTQDEEQAIERTIPLPPDSHQYALLLRNFAEHRDEFCDRKTEHRDESCDHKTDHGDESCNRNEYKFLDDALKYAKMLEQDQPSEPADAHAPREGCPSTTEDLYERFVKLGEMLKDVSDGWREEEIIAGLHPRDLKVLMLAHSEWINAQTGIDETPEPGEPRTGLKKANRKAYYTREFERVMNYHRLEAVRSWWNRSHNESADTSRTAQAAPKSVQGAL